MSNTVNVTGISPSTTKDKLREFFAFCGSIKTIDLQKDQAVITFEQPAAVNTALMLSGANLDDALLTITSGAPPQDEPETPHTKEETTIEQHEKPRAGIAAEYLAMGYKLSDNVLQRAIEIDAKQGISKRFLSYFHTLDASLGARTLGPEKTLSQKLQETVKTATEQAKSVDEQKHLTQTATDYYTKAVSSPLGQKVHSFYTTTSKQVMDIHEEARRIADHKATEKSGTEPETKGLAK